MTETEGVIKYRLDHEDGPLPPVEGLAELEAWRYALVRLALVGRDPARYGGLGFGNLSRRQHEGFLVTGTQTGQLERLAPEHFCWVRGWSLADNRIASRGPSRPSSEALTHAAVYQASPAAAVMHGHSPQLWQRAAQLGLPVTDPAAAYGTPAMAEEVAALVSARPQDVLVLAMGGHEDGIVALGPDLAAVGAALVAAWVRAEQLP